MKYVLILDFGSQYTQLIARRIRELNIYCEIIPFHKFDTLPPNVGAVILSGSPFSSLQEGAPEIPVENLLGKVPVLGVCYGAQYVAKYNGGLVEASSKREYGKAMLNPVVKDEPLFEKIGQQSQVWMSHGDTIIRLPESAICIAGTSSIDNAAYKIVGDHPDNPMYGIQFHPEVTHSLDGAQILKNFLVEIAGLDQDWTPTSFIEQTVEDLKSRIGDESVLMALSGGVDSTVGATLLHRAIGDKLHCFFIDNGLLRKNEFEQVLDIYKTLGLNVHGIDAKALFLKALEGVSDPELKRKAIGKSFIDIFEREAKAYPGIKWLGQGTIYPDVIESISVHGPSVTIKSHHNVGGLPDKLALKIVEPLRMLFKDEVRRMGKALDIPADILGRHPFPGPGLGIRILGAITPEKIRLVQEADYIFINRLKDAGLYNDVWQAAVILLPVQSVGVMGDERTYEFAVALRAVYSIDGMTAEWSRLPYEFLADVSSEIINNVKGINRVVYDISTKPPSTIEWE
jgi:GMP synthase (glutamine-hydrolysing)